MDVNNPVIGIHKYFGFQEGEIITIDGKDFLKMFLLPEMLQCKF